MRYSKEKIKEWTGVEIDTPYGYIEVLDEKKYKSSKQTKTIHALMMCFWKSGCSSFDSYENLRNHYKMVANLLEYQFVNTLKPFTKDCLWKAVKLLPIEEDERKAIIDLLRGKIAIWHSWSECGKEMASVAITQLINDMWDARVDDSPQANKFKEILTGMEKDDGYFH